MDLRGPKQSLSLSKPALTAGAPAGAEPAEVSTMADGGRATLLVRHRGREVLRAVIQDRRSDGSGVAALDDVRFVPGPDGWVEVVVHQTVLPRPGDTQYRPGPPLEVRFRRDPDGRYVSDRPSL